MTDLELSGKIRNVNKSLILVVIFRLLLSASILITGLLGHFLLVLFAIMYIYYVLSFAQRFHDNWDFYIDSVIDDLKMLVYTKNPS